MMTSWRRRLSRSRKAPTVRSSSMATISGSCVCDMVLLPHNGCEASAGGQVNSAEYTSKEQRDKSPGLFVCMIDLRPDPALDGHQAALYNYQALSSQTSPYDTGWGGRQ